MAVTKAKDDNENQEPHAGQGASGGFAPEGYGASDLVTGKRVVKEGVAERGKEGEEKLHKQAAEFQKSKVDFDKKQEEAKKAVKEGKDKNPLKDALAEEKEKQEAKAAKKPTAAGANTDLDNPVVAQSAKETVKEEAKDVQAAPAKK